MKRLLSKVVVFLLVWCGYCSASVDDDPIKHVHLIFMNHLDVGYSLKSQPGHVIDILNAYFNEFFPRAITVYQNLLVLEYRETFIYTTHPWLVSLYLDCPPNLWLSGKQLKCPDASSKSSLEDAVRAGVITWHAGPMNMEFEMLDESMMEFAIQLSIDLDKRFGLQRKYRTVSQRDVPGTTQAIIPILEKMGVGTLSIGVNGATLPSAVPPIFTWKFGNSSITTLFHPGGYPNQYGPTPMSPRGLSRKDCTVIPGLDHALCFAFRSDNEGPPMDYKEVLLVHEIARSQFPNAMIAASTFENFTSLLGPHLSSLPVVTEELGDVWIQGGGSDPSKTAWLRAMYRGRAECLKAGMCSMADPKVYNASRFMLKLSEHTWGAAGNCIDNIHWSNDQFYKLLNESGNMLKNVTDYWDEQRNFTNLALEALVDHPMVKYIQSELPEPLSHDLTDFTEVSPTSSIQCASFQLAFDSSGSLVQLTDPAGNNWASSDHPMGMFVYQTYNQSDFDKLDKASLPYSQHFFLGIGKPNLTKNAAAESRIWDTKVKSVHISSNKRTVAVRLTMVDHVTRTYYGAPKEVLVHYSCFRHTGKQGLDVIVEFMEKVPTRMPEGLNFVFLPAPRAGYKLWLNKIGELIDPLNVVTNGSQRLHAVNKGVYFVDSSLQGLEIVSLDSALVNVLTDHDFVSALPIPYSRITSARGAAFNLYNNVWETNYIFWYPYKQRDENQSFRFAINFVGNV